ncbi:isocitrate lyase/PEP mutase family protein [Acuticoccus mangrovi]|uniref:Isocitrate lyase/phosphoenolpyruvate mutase family protein n=1 Tax=Acuticoccus mangrovi TaxID=2796142 RepID=A0A934IRW6_9HYPH|nr:isocitrate lyase/phosphoenolpyruvate mutase family protein [Acuticoccus mangrovi]MBJ3777112.1 isocitrate lyase/phosphoenolpyruvate mutase family protein [Acuticoccus mangrovi]
MRALLAQDALLRAPGIIDPLAGKLVEANGFSAAYVTGGGISRSLGFPDVGLLSMTEVVDRVRLMAEAVSIPLIVDIDTGFGNALNLMRAIRLFEDAGAAAVHIEDQVTPKKCGHYNGKQIISTEEMTLKIEAALSARNDPDFLIIARTDARAVEGFDAAIKRANAYVEAGAEMIFFEAPTSKDEIRIAAKEIEAPLLINMFGGGKTPSVPIKELEDYGCKVVIFPSHLQRAAVRAMQRALDILKVEELADGEDDTLMVSFPEREELVGLKGHMALEKRYLTIPDPVLP